jgi:hypothetical protein
VTVLVPAMHNRNMTTTTTHVEPRVRPSGGDTDDKRYAHIVRAPNADAVITEAMVTGTPIVALCGKKWVPSRDPSRYPVCPRCKEIRSQLH